MKEGRDSAERRAFRKVPLNKEAFIVQPAAHEARILQNSPPKAYDGAFTMETALSLLHVQE